MKRIQDRETWRRGDAGKEQQMESTDLLSSLHRSVSVCYSVEDARTLPKLYQYFGKTFYSVRAHKP